MFIKNDVVTFQNLTGISHLCHVNDCRDEIY